MSRPILLTFDPRYSPTVNWLHAEQCVAGLATGPFPGRRRVLSALVSIVCMQWGRT